MEKHKFLGMTDLSVVTSLMTDYNVPTKIPNANYLHTITQQNDLLLLQLGSLLTSEECDDIVKHLEEKQFEEMSSKYDREKRSSSRLIVLDDRLGRTLWRRLKFAHKLSKLIPNSRPLGFNVQGDWKLSGVNPAMRINKYDSNDFFAPHKDAQYAPNADERSLLSLLIYLNDDYQAGETKFYFPKVQSQIDVKGFSIREEIDAYQGLDRGYECICVQPKKGHAVLFTHHLLHEAVPPVFRTSNRCDERIVLRSDVLVQRQNKPLGFALVEEEREDYFVCLNYFREAQQRELNLRWSNENDLQRISELYERSLSVRYCYPRLLNQKSIRKDKTEKELTSMIDKLPTEIWLNIWKFLDEPDVQSFIFAYSKFQSMQIVWQTRELKLIKEDVDKTKFIPTIETRYGCQTLFRFSDVEFFNRHRDQCCRVTAIYAFFLLGNSDKSTHYVVRFDRSTGEIFEVEMEKLFSDVFYNRHCYGSLYRVNQKDPDKRQPIVDLNRSVDRIHMMNRHQSQFIGTNIIGKFRFDFELCSRRHRDSQTGEEIEDDFDRYDYYPTDKDEVKSLIDFIRDDEDLSVVGRSQTTRSRFVGNANESEIYSLELFDQNEKTYGSSANRILEFENHRISEHCFCFDSSNVRADAAREHIHTYNHLLFDFDTHRMTVEEQSADTSVDVNYARRSAILLQRTENVVDLTTSKISHYRVNIEKLAKQAQGFNHASCQVLCPEIKLDAFSIFDYTYLTHVNLTVIEEIDHISVLAIYGGVAAL